MDGIPDLEEPEIDGPDCLACLRSRSLIGATDTRILSVISASSGAWLQE